MHVLGGYAVYTVVYGKEFLTLFVHTLVLSWYKPKRQGYFITLIAGLAIGLILSIPLSILRTRFDNLYSKTILACLQSLYIFALLAVCYKQSFASLGYIWTGIIASKGFSGNFFALLLNAAGKNDLETISFFDDMNSSRDWAINYLIHFGILVIIYFFLRKQDRLSEDFQTRRNALILAGTTFLLSGPLYSVVHFYQNNDFALAVCCKLLFVIIYLFILAVRAGLFSRGRISQELKITEQLLHQEKKHYESVKDNIEIINMKCHDIKRQLSSLQGKLTDDEITALQEAVKIYDSNIKTGSEILDVIIYQKQLYCEKNGIRLSCIADGACLAGIPSSSLYALVSNAIENAIEAVTAVGDKEKKVISFCVKKEGGYAVMEVTNYFSAPPEANGNNLQTSKSDKVHHGYGIKSMRYITENLGGTLNISTKDDIFYLTVKIPL